MATDISRFGPRYLLSGIIRNRYEKGEVLQLSTSSISHLIDSTKSSLSPFERIDLLLEHIYQKNTKIHLFVRIDVEKDFPILYCEGRSDFEYYVTRAKELELIEEAAGSSFRLSLAGWKRLEDLHKTFQSSQAFVAMSFHPSLDDAWKNGFKPALEQCQFLPIRVDLQEHNEKICDRIVAEIRKSALVVADFTGQRGGVYFEAGFAMGLGRHVIWSCQDDDIQNLHFDTRQYNHIVWKDSGDLLIKLVNRIQATLKNN